MELLGIPNRDVCITVRLDANQKDYKEVETQVETHTESGNLVTTLKSTESYCNIFQLDDEGYQKLYHALNNAQDHADNKTNPSQLKLKIITQTCLGEASKVMKGAQWVALERMAMVDGEVSKLEAMWNRGKEKGVQTEASSFESCQNGRNST